MLRVFVSVAFSFYHYTPLRWQATSATLFKETIFLKNTILCLEARCAKRPGPGPALALDGARVVANRRTAPRDRHCEQGCVSASVTSGEGRRKKKRKTTRLCHIGPQKQKKQVPSTYLFIFYFFYCVFGCFSAWGTQKQRKNFFGFFSDFLVMTQKATS